GNHRTRHARGVLPRRQDLGARPGVGDRRGRAGRDQGQPAGPGGLPRGDAAMNKAAELPEATRTVEQAYFSCRDVHAYYGESYIVQGVSFDVREGEIIA